eukprot:8481835-Alexandrium_andersonii.AAC.1
MVWGNSCGLIATKFEAQLLRGLLLRSVLEFGLGVQDPFAFAHAATREAVCGFPSEREAVAQP